MFKWFYGRKAASTVELAALIVFVLTAFLVFQRYIYRGIAGAWKTAGDAFGHGRQYDPRNFGRDGEQGGTLELFFDYTHCKPAATEQEFWDRYPCEEVEDRIYNWIDRRCIEMANPPCDCTIAVENWEAYNTHCLQCYNNCVYGQHITTTDD